MNKEKNVAKAFCSVVESIPNRDALVSEDMALPYVKLAMAAEAFALRMQERGIDHQSLVMLDTTNAMVSLSVVIATAMIGARFTPYSSRFQLGGTLKPTHLLRSPEAPDRDGVDHIDINQDWSPAVVGNSQEHRMTFGPVDTDAPWLVFSSSGTTGDPKYFTLSQRMAFDRIMAIRDNSLQGFRKNCLLFPANSRGFFIRAMAALMNGCTIIDAANLDFLQENDVDLVTGSPVQAVAWFGDGIIEPRIKTLQVTGARLRNKDAAKLLRSFEEVEDIYGSAETNQSYVNLKTLQGDNVVTKGKWLDSSIEITDESFGLCAPGETGSIRIRNGYMIDEYIGHPKATRTAFQDGWFYPGDFGCWGPDGVLEVTGRVDETINLGGVKVNLRTADETMLSVDGVSAAVAFRNPLPDKIDELMAFVVLKDIVQRDLVVPAVHKACLKKLGVLEAPKIIMVVEKLPMTADGMPRRMECQRVALILQQDP